MFQFSCRFAIFINFLSFKPTPKITRILTLYQANAPTLTSAIFCIKHTPKLGTHNMQTFKHNTFINKVPLMQSYLFNIHPKLHRRRLRKLCISLFRTFSTSQQSVDAVVRPTFIWKLSYKLPGALQLTIIQTFDQNFVFFTELSCWQAVWGVTFKICVIFGVRFERLKSW